jgi:hypothetical protein
VTITSRASSALTHGVASLATSSGRTVGRCSAEYDNTTNKDEEVAASVLITTGTTPTAAGIIEAWVFQLREDGTWPDIFTSAYSGSDGGFTVRSRDHLRAGAALLGAVPVLSTSDLPYILQPRNVAQLLGVNLVRKFAMFTTHNTAVNLNGTSSNHKTIVIPSYWA